MAALTTDTAPPPGLAATSEELKLGRRHSRRAGLFDSEILKPALVQSLVMLRPDIQWKNPVMFVVEVGTALSILYTVARLVGYESAVNARYLLALDFWLVATLLFANFASAVAEARGKAQADALRKTRRTTPARRLRTGRHHRADGLHGAPRRRSGGNRRRRGHSRRRRDHRGRGLDRRIGHHRRVGPGDPRSGRGPLGRHRRHARALRPDRGRDHRRRRQLVPRSHDRPGRGRHPAADPQRNRPVARVGRVHPDLSDRYRHPLADLLQRRAVHERLSGGRRSSAWAPTCPRWWRCWCA